MDTASRTRNEHSANPFLWIRFDKATWQCFLTIWTISSCAKIVNTCHASVDKESYDLWDGENVHFCRLAQWFQILNVEFESILNILAWHQFICGFYFGILLRDSYYGGSKTLAIKLKKSFANISLKILIWMTENYELLWVDFYYTLWNQWSIFP